MSIVRRSNLSPMLKGWVNKGNRNTQNIIININKVDISKGSLNKI